VESADQAVPAGIATHGIFQVSSVLFAVLRQTLINDALQQLVKDNVFVGGQAERVNREKIVTILLKAWLSNGSD
jgi:hypothetical protein